MVTIKRVFLLLLIMIVSTVNGFNVFAANLTASDMNIYSNAAVLMDLDTGSILFSKNINERVYPASVTKVLTAILSIENLDLSDSVVVSKTAIDLPYGSSNAGLKEGEVISIEDLLYALMLKSGNDCANVLAEAVSGSTEDFANIMNKKAKELGCVNTNFVNPHGYHDDNHYTTPRDMMKIFAYSLKNPDFLKICSTSSYVIDSTNKTDMAREYVNTNRLILSKSESYLSQYYENCICGKTGYTDEAGRTFVGYAQKGEYNLILGTFGVMDVDGNDGRYIDATTLFEYGFNNFEKKKLISKSGYSFSYYDHTKKLKFDFELKNDINGLVLKNIDLYNLAVSNNLNLNYPMIKNITLQNFNKYSDSLGNINFTFSQDDYSFSTTSDIVLKNVTVIRDYSYLSKIIANISYYIIYAIILIFVICLLIILKKNIQKKKTRRINNNYKIKKTKYSNSNSQSPSIKRRQKKF